LKLWSISIQPLHIREPEDRIMAATDFTYRDPVVHTWTYELDKAAWYDSS
jgi:hypothetical protein